MISTFLKYKQYHGCDVDNKINGLGNMTLIYVSTKGTNMFINMMISLQFSDIPHWEGLILECHHIYIHRCRGSGLIKSNRPRFEFYFSVNCIFWRYFFIFGKTLNKMFHFWYTIQSITCHAWFRSSDTKQWHMLWIWKSCFKYVTGNISGTYFFYPGVKCDGPAEPNITRSLIWKRLIASSVLWVLSARYPVSTAKIFVADIEKFDVWKNVLYQDFVKIIPKGKIGLTFAWQHETECYLGWHLIRHLWFPIDSRTIQRW